MNITGLQKMTLLDYPGKVACTVFLHGCNFRCPFCHNSGLLAGLEEPLMTREEFLTFLSRRKGLLDAVCISGGEPTLAPDLADLLAKIHDLGFLTKLDTNGSRPEVLKKLVNAGLLDYVAMDVKNSPRRYGETTGLQNPNLEKIEESLRFLLSGAVDYELRTTVVEEFHDEDAILEMGHWLRNLDPERKPKRFFLQPFVDRESVLAGGLHAPDSGKMANYRELLASFVEEISIRG